MLLYRYNGEGVPSFNEFRNSMMEDLENNGWPIKREIIEALEDEIKQAELYLSQSKELQKTSEKVTVFFVFNAVLLTNSFDLSCRDKEGIEIYRYDLFRRLNAKIRFYENRFLLSSLFVAIVKS